MPTRPCTRTTSLRRSLSILLPLALLLGAVSATETASADGTRHPYFNDRGTLRWHHTFADAKRAANREGKLIFVEYGRRKCSNCRKLAERILPHRSIRSRLAQTAVGLAAECDRPERSIYELFRRNLPGARTLPFVAFLTPDGDWVTGWAGYRKLSQVSSLLAQAESSRMQLLRERSGSCRPATPARKPAVQPRAPAPVPVLTRPPAASAAEDAELEADAADPSAGGACEGGSCKPPSFPCLPNPFELLTRKCPPKKPACPPKPVAETCPDFPPPAERIPQPKKHIASGDPDGGPTTFPTPAAQPTLPAPVVSKAPKTAKVPATRKVPVASTTTPAPKRPATATGSPDGSPSAAARTGNAQTIAAAAAARSDWATVLQHTRGASPGQPVLHALNRKVHSWAHGRLAFAVRAVREGRFSEADAAVTEVHGAMKGEAEGIDAERGAEAIELMRDMAPLAEKSLVRRTVRKTAYEKMRGSRWAPLFSPVKPPTAAVAEKR